MKGLCLLCLGARPMRAMKMPFFITVALGLKNSLSRVPYDQELYPASTVASMRVHLSEVPFQLRVNLPTLQIPHVPTCLGKAWVQINIRRLHLNFQRPKFKSVLNNSLIILKIIQSRLNQLFLKTTMASTKVSGTHRQLPHSSTINNISSPQLR